MKKDPLISMCLQNNEVNISRKSIVSFPKLIIKSFVRIWNIRYAHEKDLTKINSFIWVIRTTFVIFMVQIGSDECFVTITFFKKKIKAHPLQNGWIFFLIPHKNVCTLMLFTLSCFFQATFPWIFQRINGIHSFF